MFCRTHTGLNMLHISINTCRTKCNVSWSAMTRMLCLQGRLLPRRAGRAGSNRRALSYPTRPGKHNVNFDTRTASVYNVSKISTVQTLRSISSLRAYIIVWADFLTRPSTCSRKDQERHFNFFLGGKFFYTFQCHWKIGKKQHFICSYLTLFIVPFFLSFLPFSFFFFFSFFFSLGATAPQPPQMTPLGRTDQNTGWPPEYSWNLPYRCLN